MRWARQFSTFIDHKLQLADSRKIRQYLDHLSKKNHIESWQVTQADNALKLLSDYLSSCTIPENTLHKQMVIDHCSEVTASEIKPELTFTFSLNKLREEIRVRHYSIRTERTYEHWIKRFINYLGMKPLRDISAADIKSYLSYLAVERKVAASTQNQALL